MANSSAASRARRVAARFSSSARVGEPVFGEDHREPAEGVGLHDVGPGLEERAVDRRHGIGARDDEDLVAAFERRPAEVVGRQVEELEARAHGPVEDDDPVASRGKVGRPRQVEGQGLVRQRGRELVGHS